MTRICTVTGKKPVTGNNVSHAKNRTRRRWLPNLQLCSFPSDIMGKLVQLRVTARGIRTIEHKGGLDAWLLNSRRAKLSDEALKIRKQVEKAIVRQQEA